MNIIKVLLLAFFLILFSNQSDAQITLVNESFGIRIYAQKTTFDTLFIPYVTDYPAHTMKIFLRGQEEEANAEIYDKNGVVRVRGQFTIGKDTLIKYLLAKQLGRTDDKHHTSVRLLKYLYLFQTGTWYAFDPKGRILDKKEFVYKFY